MQRPLIGEFTRCKRCRALYTATTCSCGSDHVIVLPHCHPVVGISDARAAAMTADHEIEFCPSCWSHDEAAAVALRVDAEHNNKHNN